MERLEGILDYQSLVEVWFIRKSDVFSIKAKGILAFLKHRSSQEDSTKELCKVSANLVGSSVEEQRKEEWLGYEHIE